MATPLVILVGADKGGVGKTTVTRALADYTVARQATSKVFDTEWPAGDLKRFVPASSIIDIQKVDDQMQVFDSIAGVSLVDIKAGLLSTTIAALDEVKLLDEVKASVINMVVLHVLGPSVKSLDEITAVAASIKGARHILVKNYVNEAGFKEWDSDPRYAEILRAASDTTITVPHLSGRVCNEVQQMGSSFLAFAADRHRSRIMAGYVQTWIEHVFLEFNRVGLGALMAGAK